MLRVKTDTSGRLISGNDKAWVDEMARADKTIFLLKNMTFYVDGRECVYKRQSCVIE